MASFVNTTNPTPFGVYDKDTHFQEDADGMVTYVKRRLGDDIMSVELTSKQIWANFEESVLVFSKQINAHQAESYISNLLGMKIGPNVTYVKDISGKYVDSQNRVLTIQDNLDPRFANGNSLQSDNSVSSSPVEDQKTGPTGKEQTFPRETLEYLLRRAEPYASDAGVGGTTNSIRGYIELEQGKQDYNVYNDLVIPSKDSSNNDVKLKLEAWDNTDNHLSLFNPIYKEKVAPYATETKIKIFEVFHFSPQAAYRFFDTTSAINYLNNQFAFESFTPETVFYVLPVFEDLLRAGQLDISNRIRRSNYSYRLQGQDLRVFPRPSQDNPLNLFVKFGFPADPYKPSLPFDDSTITGVSNISNVPFGNIDYNSINQMSRQWIKQFCLALCKETLGLVRSKFSTVPIPGSDLQMNGADLISQGREDQSKLSEGLGETLDRMTYQKILESDANQSEQMMNILKRVPIPEGKAIIIG